ncbi:MAG: 3-dehydroquinate synthase [Bdellovibrionota bacterium]
MKTRVRFSRPKSAFAQSWVLLDEGVPLTALPTGLGVLRLEGGESCKRWAELERILAWLAENKAERAQPLTVIGGGATLDLGAFAASLYRRGMPLTLVPTTLLGMVDATLGGKTAVDFETGGRVRKNFAGTFYPAAEVLVTPEYLVTLPLRERISGAGEVFKTMWIRGGKWQPRALLDFVRTGEVTPALSRIIKDCLAVKASFVKRDPLDNKRIREVLNFGHTVGHALEGASSLSHGECVLWGMAAESFLLGAKPMLRECLGAIQGLKLEMPAELSALKDSDLAGDKKARGGKIEMSLLKAPGKVVKKKFTPAQLVAAVRAFPEFARREA